MSFQRPMRVPPTFGWDEPRDVEYLDRRDDLHAVLDFHNADSEHPFADGNKVAYIDLAEHSKWEGHWEIKRSGDREEILWPVRRGVAMRDNFTCRVCHTPRPALAEIDHIVPWSAGGSNKSSNLRYTCTPCNQRRGNQIDHDERPVRPVTWWCVQCWSPPEWERDMWKHELPTGLTYTEWLNIEHVVSPYRAVVNAYCAHCQCVSRTDVTL